MEKVILYGAGGIGRKNYNFLKFQGYEECVYCYCDKEQKRLDDDVRICTYEMVKNKNLPFIISVKESSKAYEEIERILLKDSQVYYKNVRDFQENNGFDMTKFERDIIAYAHIENPWFDLAEKEETVNIFWDALSPFYKMFKRLDLQHTLEFACGHGRHVSHYINEAKHVTLVDVLQDNIQFCKQRFGESNKISYYCNNGRDLSEIGNETVTSIFSYDSMVHFDMLNISEYLKEFHRVLQVGGFALVHHSNLHLSYDITFENGIHNRNYMSKNLFLHLSYMNGFEIVESIVIDWFGVKGLDCITLLRKL